jgi:hypothetical protein
MDHWGPLPVVALCDPADSFAPTLMISPTDAPAVTPLWKMGSASSPTVGTTIGTASP